MKTCPYCLESIQDKALKCRYCGEFVNPGIADKPNTFLIVLSFLLPVIGFIFGAVLIGNPRPHHKTTGQLCLICATVSLFIGGFILVAILSAP